MGEMRTTGLPVTQFAPARGARLAYQVFGSGSETVVAIPPAAQNIEVCWEYPAVRAMLERLGSFCRYLHFDKRGTGASDRRSRVPDMDERVDDLRAVMDHAGIEHAHLFGSSEGEWRPAIRGSSPGTNATNGSRPARTRCATCSS